MAAMNESILGQNLQGLHIHFVGIKGTGMAALVEICNYRGATISGSDVSERFYTDDILENLGISVSSFSENNITSAINLVIYSSAYKLDQNPDLIAATKLGIPTLLYTQALGEISKSAYSCGIAGVHGKTSTTGIVGTILKAMDLPVQVLAGSIISSFNDTNNGSCTLNLGQRFFVAETCEYQRHFMAFHPSKIILTSVESDHQDYYPTFADIQKAFVDYALLLPQGGDLIYCSDDKGAVETVDIICKKRPDINLIPYGTTAPGDYGIIFGPISNGVQYFRLKGFSNKFSITVPGKHTVRNTAASIALSIQLYKENNSLPQNQSVSAIPESVLEAIEKGVASFKGSRRRCEVIGEKEGVLVLDDYGHHPTAVKTTLEGIRDFYSDRVIIVDFMSHTYTRTAALLEEFAESVSYADYTILNKIYPSARENIESCVVNNVPVTGKLLYEKAQKYSSNVYYADEILDALPIVKEIVKKPLPKGKKGYVLVTMGAGDNWKLGKAFLKD